MLLLVLEGILLSRERYCSLAAIFVYFLYDISLSRILDHVFKILSNRLLPLQVLHLMGLKMKLRKW
jgi:hypothetical protein